MRVRFDCHANTRTSLKSEGTVKPVVAREVDDEALGWVGKSTPSPQGPSSPRSVDSVDSVISVTW